MTTSLCLIPSSAKGGYTSVQVNILFSYTGYTRYDVKPNSTDPEKGFMYKNWLIYNKQGDALNTSSIYTPTRGLPPYVHISNIEHICGLYADDIKMIKEICFVRFE